ncbi:helix-turn-helix domain-containing protein [Salinarchaeum sp. Harcht-Bsk1]|uniref:helix-turn-helix domain-containing protein n=1 Tax=Salinarchaeum sp. Harcht-Bsk1 TaxID=1333523 RepID=UPI000677BC90|nr:helix-turn-helix domain-containing protein [Salinarchaeum sp. Harcht-Bsk1]
MTAQIRVEIPPGTWMEELSTRYPNVRFRLLAGVEVDGGEAVELGEVNGELAVEAAAAVGDHVAIGEYETLYASDERVLSRYRTGDLTLYDFLRSISVPPEFPLVVEDGWLECSITASRDRIDELDRTLTAAPVSYELRSLVAEPDSERLLTDRQRELLRAAFENGYYDVPREQTLTDLAATLDVDPSTASGVLRRAERQVVAWFLSSEVHTVPG